MAKGMSVLLCKPAAPNNCDALPSQFLGTQNDPAHVSEMKKTVPNTNTTSKRPRSSIIAPSPSPRAFPLVAFSLLCSPSVLSPISVRTSTCPPVLAHFVPIPWKPSLCDSFIKRRSLTTLYQRASCTLSPINSNGFKPSSLNHTPESNDSSMLAVPKPNRVTPKITTLASSPQPLTEKNAGTTEVTTEKPESSSPSTPCKSSKTDCRSRAHSSETRRKISLSMMGNIKTAEMRAKLSEKMKGRIPWNKGKKMSKETRARMSAAKLGKRAWNKGSPLSADHRLAISNASSATERHLSEETKARMRMARRRPGDALVSGNLTKFSKRLGSYRLVDSEDINAYISLRRELRTWSDNFAQHHSGKRPSLADIRRMAQVPVIRKFEKYMAMRERIRGLAGDVYGSVNPSSIPSVSTKDLVDSPVNNNHTRSIHITKHGNTRLVEETGDEADQQEFDSSSPNLHGTVDDMFDIYDRPSIAKSSGLAHREDSFTNKIESENTLIGAHVLTDGGSPDSSAANGLSASDFRKIGHHRLMETMDINKFVKLRRELRAWSFSFQEVNGYVPSLSDAREFGHELYAKFCDYLDMRERMGNLVSEVYGAEVDDLETLRKLNVEGKEVLNTLTNEEDDRRREKE